MSVIPAVPLPGWYADPTAPEGLRWWDGSAWTEHMRSRPNQIGDAAIHATVEPSVSQPITTPGLDLAATMGANSPAPDLVQWSRDPMILRARAAAASRPQYVAPGSPHTVSSWVLAALPAIIPIVLLIALFVLRAAGADAGLRAVPFPVWFAGIAVTATVLAVADSRVLRSRGYLTASPAWASLFSPLLYLVFRARKLRRAGVRSSALGVVGVLTFVIGSAFTFWVAGFASPAVSSAKVVTSVQSDMEAKSGSSWELDCPRVPPAVGVGQTISCTATATDGSVMLLDARVTRSGEIRYTARPRNS